jgi:hypothetical protein
MLLSLSTSLVTVAVAKTADAAAVYIDAETISRNGRGGRTLVHLRLQTFATP